ncbi:hypothetical protein SAV14893_048090 [Streptomyces avermitilis]|uniref:Uncharacterized protein n=1 Tax=Streptomyces avermitilis TaxID=33903 RepID=A0A4D4LZU0_STRAX|nr:hypothetical protein SAV14893_048090 [Streptomyces avermitilis]GDY74377.1 hypothetical protein SAV31267_038620 [Streptomyces avermitilis]
MPGEFDVPLPVRKALARGHPELPLHQVEAGDQLGDRVLDLKAGVHLHEVVRGGVPAGDDELDGARALVAAGAGRLDRRLAHRGAGRLVEEHAGRLLDDLLVAALERALALAQVHHVAVAVRQDLDLDVPGAVHPTLHEERVVAEGGAGLAAGGGDLVGEQPLVAHQPHALAAAARAGLQEYGHADLPCRVDQLGVRQAAARGAGDHRDADRLHRLLGADLVAHQGDRVRGRPDEHEPRVGARTREAGVLREEAVPRVHRLRAGPGGRLQQPLHGQIALGGRRRTDPYGRVGLADVPCVRVGVGEDGHRAHAQRAQGTDDADGDLTPVGHKNGVEHSHPHIRKTPKPGAV